MVANVTAFTSGRDLASVSENVELLTGQRGNKLDKAVTYRDLESLGVATLSRIGSSYSAKANPVLTTTASVVDTPTKPKNVQANGAFNTILIDWDEPDYRGHSYAEVWRSETDNLSAAVKVGTTSARMYSDPIGGDAKVYYWVRFVNSKDVPGPFNSSAGTYAETAVDVQQLLDSLQGQIAESQLAKSLTDKIDLIDTNIASIQQINVNIQSIDADISKVNVDLSDIKSSQVESSNVQAELSELISNTRSDLDASISNISAINTDLTSINTDLTSLRSSQENSEAAIQAEQSARSSADNAMAQQITDLSSTVKNGDDSLNSKITSLTQSTTTAYQALSQRADSIESAYKSADATQSAAISSLSSAVADFESSTVTQFNELNSSVDGLNSDITVLQQSVATQSETSANIYSSLQSKTDIAAIAAANAALSDDESSRSSRSSEASIRTNLKVLTNDHESLSKIVDVLQADFETETASLSAQIATEQTTRSTAIESLSQQITTLDSAYKSSDSTISASIATEQTARANADTALSQQITILQASVNDNLAEIQSEQTARVTADESLSQQITTLKSEYKAADSTLSASIATEQTARTAADSALSQQISVVQSAVDGNTSAIQSEQTARTTADAALAQDIATLTASVGTNSAAIQSESTARASADSALTSLVNTAQAKADSAYSAVQTEITNRTAADSALSQQITTLQASVASNTAAIQSVATARASADSAQSTQINTVQAVLAGDPSNLFLNPNFDPGQPHGFSGNGDANVHDAAYQWAPAGCPAPNYLEVWNRDVNGKTIPVTPGDVYHFGMSCATGDGGAPRIGIGCMAMNAAGGVIGYYLVAMRSDANPTWKKISGEMTVPAGATQIRMWVQLDYFRDVNTNHWWAITGIQWTNANATKALSASVQTQSQAISTLENGAQAMWTAKTQVGQITSGIGVMTDSNGKSQVMISASQLFMFDPNGTAPTRSIFAVSNGQVVIQKAVIEAATIETVTAMSITADYVRAGVSLTSPNLVGGTLSIGSGDNALFLADGAIGIGKGGPYGGWGWGWHTIIYSDGGIYTDRLHASSGDFTGYVHATSGYFENVTIAENCDVRGTIYANKIVGDVIAIKPMNLGFYTGGALYKIYKNQEVAAFSFNLSASNVARYIKINGSSCDGSNVYMKLYIGGDLVASRPNGVDGMYVVPAKSGVTVVQFNLWYVNNGADYIYTAARLVGEVVVYPVSSGTFV